MRWRSEPRLASLEVRTGAARLTPLGWHVGWVSWPLEVLKGPNNGADVADMKSPSTVLF